MTEAGETERCVIVVDRELPPGRAANAASVIALTLGGRRPDLIGPELVDADGGRHPGLIPGGIAVLAAPGETLQALRRKAATDGLAVVAFPVGGQSTTDYEAFRRLVAATPGEALALLGLGLYGPRRAIGRLVGSLPLLK